MNDVVAATKAKRDLNASVAQTRRDCMNDARERKGEPRLVSEKDSVLLLVYLL